MYIYLKCFKEFSGCIWTGAPENFKLKRSIQENELQLINLNTTNSLKCMMLYMHVHVFTAGGTGPTLGKWRVSSTSFEDTLWFEISLWMAVALYRS